MQLQKHVSCKKLHIHFVQQFSVLFWFGECPKKRHFKKIKKNKKIKNYKKEVFYSYSLYKFFSIDVGASCFFISIRSMVFQ